jgi:hypothetical protein
MTSECTDPPEKIWFTKVGKNIIPNSQRMSPEDVEYLRKDKHIAYLADYRSAYEGSCEQIDELRAEVARLRAALERIEKVNGVVHNYISCYDCRESSMIASAALSDISS